MDQLPSLSRLLKVLQQVPYLASKNLYRVAEHFLKMDDVQVEHFCRALIDSKKNIVACARCCAWKEERLVCLFCDARNREQSLVCVVESWQELIAIEKTGGYRGVFHVLGGVICPLEGVGPEDLSIDILYERIQSGEIHELIFAMNQTPEGEATSAFIAHKIKEKNVVISSLAKGVPIGSSLEFMDRLTLHKALVERRPF
jgi:recombination protein RecR